MDFSLFVYSTVDSPRLQYVLKICFSKVVQLNYVFTTDTEKAKSHAGPVLEYNEKRSLKSSFFIQSTGLLFESKLRELVPERVELAEGKMAFFPSYKAELEFDVFSCVFYWVSRYEEYLPFLQDRNGRFEADQSLAYKTNILAKPFVHHWVFYLLEKLTNYGFNLTHSLPNYSFIPTIDVDTAYAYRGKGLMRTAGALVRSVLKVQIKDAYQRVLCVLGNKKDPFDTYEVFLRVQKKYKLKSLFFFLIGDYGLNDKNLPFNSPLYTQLIKYLGDYVDVALHPSFSTINTPENIKMEADRLKKITYREITKSRQHFLVLRHPNTYHDLLKYGFTDDYTMGYASEPGFRSGMCVPYPFFDLTKNTEADLQIHPFPIMEATFKYYKKFGPEKSLDIMVAIANEVKQVGGTLYTVWHNDSLSNKGDWRGWQELYPRFVERIYA